MSGSRTNPSSHIGLLLIGHGTRDSLGLAEFARVVLEVEKQFRPGPSALWPVSDRATPADRRSPGVRASSATRRPAVRLGAGSETRAQRVRAVQGAFLELATPTISAGIEQLIERGVRDIVVSPLLLFAAGHAKQDIPAAIEAAIQAHSGIEWQPADPLGCHPALLELSARRFAAAIQGHSIDVCHCRFVLVGRGSHDAEAIQETAHYARLLAARVGIDEPQVAFLAMAQPRLGEVLAAAAESQCSSVVVQPHLLFHGELLEDIHRQVGVWRARVPDKQWILTEHLGAEPEVVAAVVERCVEIW